MLSVENLECIRGERLLFSGLSFCLLPGQLMQIEGENGSGKTSLLRLLAGLSRPTGGTIMWRGEAISRNRYVYQSDMAYMGHALGVKAELSPLENLQASLPMTGKNYSAGEISAALNKTGLRRSTTVAARTLSAGQNQRIALARLLLHPGKLWILDEPFTALDVSGIALVGQLLVSHIQTGGMAVLTSHQPLEIDTPLVRLSLT